MGRSMGTNVYGDPYERPLQWLNKYRAELARGPHARREAQDIRRSIAYWRQTITVSVAAQRADAGDQTGARRLAWRNNVLKQRSHARWLWQRFETLDAEIRRLVRRAAASCPTCSARLERARRDREEFLAEIAALPGTVQTYAEYAREHPIAVAAVEAPAPSDATGNVIALDPTRRHHRRTDRTHVTIGGA